MIRVLVMANDSVLADAIVSTLKQEVDLDVTRLTRRTLGAQDHQSIVIIIDEGEAENEEMEVKDFIRSDITLLVIKISLNSRDIYVYESYQLLNPGVERIQQMVTGFCRKILKEIMDDDGNADSLKKMTNIRQPLTDKYHRIPMVFSAGRSFMDRQPVTQGNRSVTDGDSPSLLWESLLSILFHIVRRNDFENVMRSTLNRSLTGAGVWRR